MLTGGKLMKFLFRVIISLRYYRNSPPKREGLPPGLALYHHDVSRVKIFPIAIKFTNILYFASRLLSLGLSQLQT